jgi:hypothetical protein
MKIEWSPAARASARRYLTDQDGMRATGGAIAQLAGNPCPPEAFHRDDYHRLRAGDLGVAALDVLPAGYPRARPPRSMTATRACAPDQIPVACEPQPAVRLARSQALHVGLTPKVRGFRPFGGI